MSALLCLPMLSAAQSGVAERRSALLDSIVKGNTTLRALRQGVEAGKAGMETSLRLPDPEVGFSYKWGAPAGVPAVKGVDVTQQLDWGVLTGRRRRLAQSGAGKLEQDYRISLRDMLAEADRIIVNLTYYNLLCDELKRRLAVAQEVMSLCSKRYERGDLNAIDLNKIRLNTTLAQTELKRALSERQSLQFDLNRLGGKADLAWNDTVYAVPALPPLDELRSDIETASPELAAADAAIRQEHDRLRLTRTEGLPNLSVGYTGEYINGERHSGVTMGLSIPLWGNSRKKTAESRALLALSEMERADAAKRLETNLMKRYASARNLRQTADKLTEDLARADNAHLIRRSLELGQISLLDYLLEISFYYNARTQQLEAERDAQMALVELWQLIDKE